MNGSSAWKSYDIRNTYHVRTVLSMLSVSRLDARYFGNELTWLQSKISGGLATRISGCISDALAESVSSSWLSESVDISLSSVQKLPSITVQETYESTGRVHAKHPVRDGYQGCREVLSKKLNRQAR